MLTYTVDYRGIAENHGYRVHHDIHGWYIVDPGEEEPEDGYSLGFDGREHYDTEEAAWTNAAARALEDC